MHQLIDSLRVVRCELELPGEEEIERMAHLLLVVLDLRRALDRLRHDNFSVLRTFAAAFLVAVRLGGELIRSGGDVSGRHLRVFRARDPLQKRNLVALSREIVRNLITAGPRRTDPTYPFDRRLERLPQSGRSDNDTPFDLATAFQHGK